MENSFSSEKCSFENCHGAMYCRKNGKLEDYNKLVDEEFKRSGRPILGGGINIFGDKKCDLYEVRRAYLNIPGKSEEFKYNKENFEKILSDMRKKMILIKFIMPSFLTFSGYRLFKYLKNKKYFKNLNLI